MNTLQSYDWPGNVRELQNVIDRAVITSQGGALHFDLPEAQGAHMSPAPPAPASAMAIEVEVMSDAEMRRLERANLLAALKRTGWKIHGHGGAADLLGVKPTTLFSRIQKMGLTKPE